MRERPNGHYVNPPEPVITWGPVEILPVLHGVMEFAVVVRQVMQARTFAHVAVELPPTLRDPVISAVRRLPAISVVHYPVRPPVSDDEAASDDEPQRVYLMVEPTCGLMEAVRSAVEQKQAVHFIDRDTEGYPSHGDPLPDPYTITRIGSRAYLNACLQWTREQPPEDPADPDRLREVTMAYRLQQLARSCGPSEKVLCVCGLNHATAVRSLLETEQIQPLGRVRRQTTLSHLDIDSARQVTTEPSYLRHAYETWRAEPETEDPPDRFERLSALYREARDARVADGWDRVDAKALGMGLRFARNWALLEGRLTPDLYQTVMAARGIADDDFAFTVWKQATDTEAQQFDDGLPVIHLNLEDLDRSSRLIRFRRRMRQRTHRWRRVVRKRPKESYPGEWRDAWRPWSVCSYPPEDLTIESYGAFLQKKARSILSEETVRTEPFTVSLGDGIDIRQTIRNWHEGRIHVRFQQAVRGKVGAVLVILDPDDTPVDAGEERFPWKLTWQGEHDQESDMAFYATPLGDRLSGPGISRCDYGGFLMTYPPGRMFDVWEDPFFDTARDKPERLLLAALDYCEDPLVVYVAETPPANRYKELARRLGKKVVYIPVGQLSPVTLKQIRTFHVLAGRHVRTFAKEYLD